MKKYKYHLYNYVFLILKLSPHKSVYKLRKLCTVYMFENVFMGNFIR